jgi:hypothetical protein
MCNAMTPRNGPGSGRPAAPAHAARRLSMVAAAALATPAATLAAAPILVLVLAAGEAVDVPTYTGMSGTPRSSSDRPHKPTHPRSTHLT